ncbi:hypothetical protein N7472_004763 [Penicillium cf. griseofulvum]|uniref:Uncharacterized protein n=1 Tax=Penicillium cf. griseofulvum TaxID=2972120 RepID=A0A9W9JME5_9EURO|nr:hypothetical protein N7472_004763 [Penicillium cf. griseofulvum]
MYSGTCRYIYLSVRTSAPIVNRDYSSTPNRTLFPKGKRRHATYDNIFYKEKTYDINTDPKLALPEGIRAAYKVDVINPISEKGLELIIEVLDIAGRTISFSDSSESDGNSFSLKRTILA